MNWMRINASDAHRNDALSLEDDEHWRYHGEVLVVACALEA